MQPVWIVGLGNDGELEVDYAATIWQNFWTTHYGPETSALILAGDLTEADAKRLAENISEAGRDRASCGESPTADLRRRRGSS